MVLLALYRALPYPTPLHSTSLTLLCPCARTQVRTVKTETMLGMTLKRKCWGPRLLTTSLCCSRSPSCLKCSLKYALPLPAILTVETVFTLVQFVYLSYLSLMLLHSFLAEELIHLRGSHLMCSCFITLLLALPYLVCHTQLYSSAFKCLPSSLPVQLYSTYPSDVVYDDILNAWLLWSTTQLISSTPSLNSSFPHNLSVNRMGPRRVRVLVEYVQQGRHHAQALLSLAAQCWSKHQVGTSHHLMRLHLLGQGMPPYLLYIRLYICLYICLPACLYACLSLCPLICLPTFQLFCRRLYALLCISPYLSLLMISLNGLFFPFHLYHI